MSLSGDRPPLAHALQPGAELVAPAREPTGDVSAQGGLGLDDLGRQRAEAAAAGEHGWVRDVGVCPRLQGIDAVERPAGWGSIASHHRVQTALDDRVDEVLLVGEVVRELGARHLCRAADHVVVRVLHAVLVRELGGRVDDAAARRFTSRRQLPCDLLVGGHMRIVAKVGLTAHSIGHKVGCQAHCGGDPRARGEPDTGRSEMKATVVTDQAAGTAGMTLVERPEPPAAINDVIVEVHASGFVPTELEWPSTWTDRRGRDRTPSIPGHELAGVVTALGYGTTGVSVGQRVLGLADWHRDGTLAEYVAIEARNLAPLPGDVEFTVGASLPISGLTAWQGLFDHGRIRAGQSVLAHGAAGAVGTMVTQLAREAGAYVIGTGRAADRQKVLDFGAHEFVDLENDALEDIGGVDLVFDVIGGDTQERSARLVRPGGTLVTVVGPTEARPADGLTVDFVVESDRAQLSEIVQRVRDGRLRTNIGTVATLDDVVAALNPTERLKGKTIIHVRP